jgi:hypothetical protein
MRFASLASGLFLAVSASALPAQTDSAAPPPPPPPAKSSSRQITDADIERLGSSAANAYDVVQMLRPQWLRKRNDVLNLPGVTAGDTGMPEFSVFVDDHEMGGLNFLRALPAEQVYSMRFLTMNEVGVRYGPTNGPGIIVILRH